MYRFMKLFSAFICMLPHSIQYAIGALLGEIAWLVVPPKRKRLAIGQILFCKITDDPVEAKRIAKASTTRFGRMIIDVLRYPEIKDGDYRDMVTFINREILDEALADGKGAILAAVHSGNWELLGGVLASEGYPLISVAMKQNGDADKFINEYREIMHQHVMYKTSVRDMVKALKNGAFLGLIMDQDPGEDGVLVPFFGYETLTADGPAVLEVHQPLYVEKTDDKKRDIAVTTIILNEFIEDYIRRYPEDWFWLHNRWKWTRRYYGEKIETPPDVFH